MNPYYSPEAVGLEIIGEIDDNKDHEFNMIVA
jgi:hypothetical protein